MLWGPWSPYSPVILKGGLEPQLLGIRPRQRLDLGHPRHPPAALTIPEVLTLVSLSSSTSWTLQPNPGLLAAPDPRPAHSHPTGTDTHPNCTAACGGACGPRSTAGSGARNAGWSGLRRGALGQGPAARLALRAGHIPAVERALDLRGCTLGPQLPPPPPSLLPGGPPPTHHNCADVAAVNQPAPAAPWGGGSRVLGLRGSQNPNPRSGRQLLGCAAWCPPHGPRAGRPGRGLEPRMV
jgi:hypothetical protein